jgi:hypothetical protein
MADALTFTLGQNGYDAFKYVPYGPIGEVGGGGVVRVWSSRLGRLGGWCCAAVSGALAHSNAVTNQPPTNRQPPLNEPINQPTKIARRQVLPYLVRRAQENSAVVQGAAVTRQMAMLRSEIGRRLVSRA